MPKALPRTKARVEHLASAIEALTLAHQELSAINLRKVGNGPLKDAVRKARNQIEDATFTAREALHHDADLLRKGAASAQDHT